MITSWFTLKKLEHILQTQYSNSILTKCVTYQKNECLLLFEEKPALLIHLGSPFPYMLLQDNPPVRKTTLRVFNSLENEIVDNIRLYEQDRVLEISFRDGCSLNIALVSQRGNIYFSRNEDYESFKKSGSIPDIQEMRQKTLPCFTSTEDDFRFNRFWTENSYKIMNCENYQQLISCILSSNGQRLNGRFVLSRDSGFDADIFYHNYREFVINYLREDNFDRRHQDLKGLLSGQMQRFAKQLKKTSQKDLIKKRIEKNIFFADTLNSLRYSIKNGMVKLEIPDYLQKDDFPSEIPLKAELTANDQINRYYSRAQKNRQELKDLQERIMTLKSSWDELNQLYDSLEKLSSISELRNWEKCNSKIISAYKKRASDPAGEHSPYRQVILDTSWRIWIGKSARDNDDLTFHYANKQDLWLHTRHSTGSHVIIKKDGKKEVPTSVIVRAAALAARYSDEKHSSLVTVVCTAKKYVSKRKGMPPGKVHFQYEKDYMVTPAQL